MHQQLIIKKTKNNYHTDNMSPNHPAMNAAAMDDTFGTTGRVRGRLRYEGVADASAGAALVEYTDDEDDAHEDDEDDEDFIETAAQLSSVDGRFAEEGSCKQEGNGTQEGISISPATPIDSHPIDDGDSDEEDAIAHSAAIAPTAFAAAAVPAAAASIFVNAVPNHEFKTTTSARGVPIPVARDRPGSSLYEVIIVFVAVGIPPTVDTFGTNGRVRGRLRCEESLQQ